MPNTYDMDVTPILPPQEEIEPEAESKEKPTRGTKK